MREVRGFALNVKIAKGANLDGKLRARRGEVPLGGTARLLPMLCRMYTILPFFFFLRGSWNPESRDAGFRAVERNYAVQALFVNGFELIEAIAKRANPTQCDNTRGAQTMALKL